jgi:hypothetical protein
MAPQRRPLSERIVGKYLERGDECWPWIAGTKAGGYGNVLRDGDEGRPRRFMPAHRAMYELHRGPIPAGMDLDHRGHDASNFYRRRANGRVAYCRICKLDAIHRRKAA